MESRFRVLFLIVAIVSLPGCAATKNLFGLENEAAPPPTARRHRRTVAANPASARISSRPRPVTSSESPSVTARSGMATRDYRFPR